MSSLKALLIAAALLTAATQLGVAQDRAFPAPAPINPTERQELEIFRMAAQVQSKGYEDYLKKYYEQEGELGDLAVQVLRWQIFAANIVLALVVLLTVAGVAFAGYQLWVSARLALMAARRRRTAEAAPGPAGFDAGTGSIEVSVDRVQLQTSFVGVLVLVISGAFLILFVREVYKVNVSDMRKEPPKVEQTQAAKR
jgi:hypothetical protein